MTDGVSWGRSLRSLRRDLVQSVRGLARDRAFSLICIVSLGIGMGAVVALATFGRALEAPARGIDTDGLVEVLVLPSGPLRVKAGVWALERWSYPDYQALRDADIGMEITGWSLESREFGVAAERAPQPRVAALYVSPNYFRTFGVALARGSGFDSPRDDSPAAEPRVIVSHGLWQNRLAGDPDIVGKTVIVDGVPHTVVGITPEDFRGHFHFFQAPASLVYLPLERHPRLRQDPALRDDRAVDWVHVHGRLHPGVSREQAAALVSSTMAALAEQYPATNQFKSATAEPYASLGAAERPQSRRIFAVLLGLAGTVLLVVCVNISGMMLVRGARRAHELSIRAALGADRRALLQHLFIDAVVLASVAGAVSAIVPFGVPAFIAWSIGVPVPEEVDFDATGALIAVGLCLVVSVLFGLLPALRFSRPSLLPALKDTVGAGGGSRTIRAHRLAAIVQVGIAIPFLVTSGVMIDRVRTAGFGFPIDGLAGARIPASVTTSHRGALRPALADLQSAAGVRSVAVAEGMPIDFDYREFRVGSVQTGTFATAHVTRVGENFLETVGARLLRGRSITADDRFADADVAVVTESLAVNLFGSADAIGQRVVVSLDDGREREATIVGVAADFASSQLTTTRLQILLPLPELTVTPAGASPDVPSTMYLIVRGEAGDEPRLAAALETALRRLGVEPLPGVAFPGIVTGRELDEKSRQDLIAEGTAVGVAGGLVLVLAALGILGVVGFMVATRTREFAVRMALGSTRARVFGLALKDSLALVVPGIAGGLLLSSVLIRTMENVMGTPLLLGPEPLGVMEPVIYAVASMIAVGAALLAGLPAARRATSIEPMAAIRSE